ncbi:LysM peptidoglycan-binding domain-containing protein [Hungatella hathewayi]|uniref:cell division suppressor protein YneA n=1 Tax=Hungatella hathewayi TaxID=154046 RepID=UPI00210E5300|nr:LysM peptidoglycan-binding domain-containing protein [Hungatella hathewayi]MCQ5383348.1 LysM peptidoglycan-binding domain-containing protein [Hungatella hathewayi]
MKKIMITMALVVLILSNVCGHSLMNALADETELPESQKYYTSIEIQKGDTLWGIADEYAGSCRMSTADYVTELKNMNGLKEDVIHSGQHLTIMYCVPVSEVLVER